MDDDCLARQWLEIFTNKALAQVSTIDLCWLRRILQPVVAQFQRAFPLHSLHPAFHLHHGMRNFPHFSYHIFLSTPCFLRAYSDLADQAERPNPKLLSKGEDRSPLKYIISVLLLDSEYFIEKKFGLSLEFGFPFLKDPNSYREVKFLAPKVPKSVAM